MQKHERKGVAGGVTGEVVENKGAKMTGRVVLTRQASVVADGQASDYHEGKGRVQ
jgi:hypothetical protein